MTLLKLNPIFSNEDLFFPTTVTQLMDNNSNNALCHSLRPSSLLAEDDDNDKVINVINDDMYQLSIDVPGVHVSDLNLKVEANGRVHIEGVRRRYIGGGSGGETTAQKKYRFEKTYTLNPQVVDLAKAKANLADGVLVITIPKKPKLEPLTISITTNPHEQPSTSDNGSVNKPADDKKIENNHKENDKNMDDKDKKESVQVQTVDPKEEK